MTRDVQHRYRRLVISFRRRPLSSIAISFSPRTRPRGHDSIQFDIPRSIFRRPFLSFWLYRPSRSSFPIECAARRLLFRVRSSSLFGFFFLLFSFFLFFFCFVSQSRSIRIVQRHERIESSFRRNGKNKLSIGIKVGRVIGLSLVDIARSQVGRAV